MLALLALLGALAGASAKQPNILFILTGEPGRERSPRAG